MGGNGLVAIEDESITDSQEMALVPDTRGMKNRKEKKKTTKYHKIPQNETFSSLIPLFIRLLFETSVMFVAIDS
jgi:hypothetical protein